MIRRSFSWSIGLDEVLSHFFAGLDKDNIQKDDILYSEDIRKYMLAEIHQRLSALLRIKQVKITAMILDPFSQKKMGC